MQVKPDGHGVGMLFRFRHNEIRELRETFKPVFCWSLTESCTGSKIPLQRTRSLRRRLRSVCSSDFREHLPVKHIWKPI
jgi:hypothetical protein